MNDDHIPVLLRESMDLLSVQVGGTYIDATVGLGGHASRILEMSGPAGRLLGMDADSQALDSARVRLSHFAGRVSLSHSYFDHLGEVARAGGFSPADGILFDLGLSSYQLATPERGFSFQHSGPLDMRMGTGAERTAAELVNSLPAERLERVIKEYGEERYARRIARAIVETRTLSGIQTTEQLARVIRRAMPRGASSHGIDPATRTFQALRIAVNNELDRLSTALPQALSLLRSGGRLVVITFHSLEDRIVKRFLQAEAKGCICPPEAMVCLCGRVPSVRILTRRPVRPSEDEVRANPRSRSAKLRAAEAI